MDRTLAALRAPCHALLTPSALVLEAGDRARPLLRRRDGTGRLEEQFSSAVADLLQMIDESAAAGRRLNLVVSDFWARPLLLALPGKVPSDEEIDTLLELQYRRSYGDLMDGWVWCWERQGPRLIAVAWPAAGLQLLREGLAARRWVLASAVPLAVAVGAQHGGDNGAAWVAVLEAHSLSLLRLDGGAWEDWCVMRTAGEVSLNLPLQIAREAARHQDACRSLIVLDLSATTNVPALRKALHDAGWSVQVRGLQELGEGAVRRLWREISAGATT